MDKLKIDQSMEENNFSHINTEVIRPIAQSSQSILFNIENRGGSLDRHTTIVLPAICGNPQQFLPINVGIAALIRSATLSIGGKVIAQNDNVGHWVGLQSSFQQQEFRDRVLKCRHGIREQYDPCECGQVNIGAGVQRYPPGKITLKDLNYAKTFTNTNQNSAAVSHSLDTNNGRNYMITNDVNTTARLYLRLEDLFPRLYGGTQLPIHMLTGLTQLRLQLNPADSAICNSQVNIGAGVGSDYQLIADEVVLLTDYLVNKNDDEVAAKIMSPEGLSIVYGDLVWQNTRINGQDTLPDNTSRNYVRYELQVPMANQIVRQMYMMFNPQRNPNVIGAQLANDGAGTYKRVLVNADGRPPHPLKNIYSSDALSYLADGCRIQVKVNQSNVYNQPLENAGHYIHELQSAYGASFCMPQSTYNYIDACTDADEVATAGTVVNAGVVAGILFPEKGLISQTANFQNISLFSLTGSNFYVGVNMQKPLLTNDGRLMRVNMAGAGTKIGQSPIIVEIDRLTPINQQKDNRDVRICCVVEKVMNIRNGMVNIVEQ